MAFLAKKKENSKKYTFLDFSSYIIKVTYFYHFNNSKFIL